MKISVVDPVNKAMDHMMNVCFRPFDIQKWLGLGFCAWLATLGQGGGGGNFNVPSGGGGGGGQSPFDIPEDGGGAQDWGQTLDAGGLDPSAFHGAMADVFPFDPEVLLSGTAIAIGVVALLLIMALGILVSWISSRGQFMFLDGVVHNRGNVVAPWNEFREQGNSLFKVNLVLFVIIMGIVLLALGGSLGAIFGLGEPTTAIPILIGVGLLTFLLLIPFIIFGFLMNHFVVPTMYLKRATFGEAWPVVRQEVISGNVGAILAFVGMNILFAFATAIVGALVTCLTCCIAALPYVGTVILLPVLVFLKSYSLYFFEEFGPQFKLFPGSSDDDALASW